MTLAPSSSARNTDSVRYRADIDGLRAIAVLSVLCSHLDVSSLRGGFVGVDIFFVISGFLITRLIVDEVDETGTFRFGRFYVRRVRRLFPALFTTCLLSLAAGLVLFSPEDLERLARSVVYAALSASNVLFWTDADYFDVVATTKPLLHTWSLGVEEQFYLVWPATLVLLIAKAPRWAVCAALVALALVSVGVAEFWLGRDTTAAFYLLPARIFEFVCGAVVVWMIRAWPASARLREVLLVAGLGLIVYALVTFTPDMRFPGLTALVPCIGAAVAIYAGTARFAGALLRNSLANSIGRWSYSIYLVHWPLLVFYRAFMLAELGSVDRAALAAVSIGVGWLQFRFVEESFRYERAGTSLSRGRFSVSAALLMLALVVPATAIWKGSGLPNRIPIDRRSTPDVVERQHESETCNHTDPSKPSGLFTCQNFRGMDKDIILWGDSHARHLIVGISNAFPNYNVYVMYLSGCNAQSGTSGYVNERSSIIDRNNCVRRNRDAQSFLSTYRPSVVVLSSAKQATPAVVAGPSNTIIASLTAAGHTAFMIGDFVRPSRSLASCWSVPALVIDDAHIRERCVGLATRAKYEMQYNIAMEGLVPRFVNPNAIQCPDGTCRYFKDGKLLYRDDHHLSSFGSDILIRSIRDKLPM